MPEAIATAAASTANSFATVDEGDEYMDARLNSSAWTNADDDDKARALIEATRELSALPWSGTRVSNEQALSWPRAGVVNLNDPSEAEFGDDVIPQCVKDATCELALAFLKSGTNDLAGVDPAEGVIRKKIDVIETEWAPGSKPVGLSRVPRVLNLIGSYLSSDGLEIVRT